MSDYTKESIRELKLWQKKMLKKPSFASSITKGLQNKFNNLIPDKANKVITEAIKNTVKVVLLGSEFTTKLPLMNVSLEQRERLVKEKINSYRKAAVVSGAGTGAGGLLLGLADFPILLGIKIKLLFEIASLYGFNAANYKERLYILYIFQLAFSSPERRLRVYAEIKGWENYVKYLPEDVDCFDWRTFQQEYRDYIDLAKMLQLVPGIGAIVGAYANYQLIDKLGETAINAYRMRIFKKD